MLLLQEMLPFDMIPYIPCSLLGFTEGNAPDFFLLGKRRDNSRVSFFEDKKYEEMLEIDSIKGRVKFIIRSRSHCNSFTFERKKG